MIEEFEDDGEFESSGDARDPAEIAGELLEADSRWRAEKAIDLGDGHSWQPDLVAHDESALLHVHVADRLRGYAVRRFAKAIDAGIEVHVATTLGRLLDSELLDQLAASDAHIHLLDEDYGRKPERVLAILADEGIKVAAEVRKALGRHGFEFSKRDGTADQKGKRFEALVAFLLSQVEGFSIYSRNYKTSTEEIDVVIQRTTVDARVWSLTNAPFILVEAKNHADGISQAMFSTFRVKMQTKRATVRIGLMLSRTKVSGAATEQESKFASEELTIVFMNGDAIAEWIEADDGSKFLARQIAGAMLG